MGSRSKVRLAEVSNGRGACGPLPRARATQDKESSIYQSKELLPVSAPNSTDTQNEKTQDPVTLSIALKRAWETLEMSAPVCIILLSA
ncbi:hypothetical protein RRG08_065477 [Elysia crispata]|uniref:Uncharacterized protein n=1 Tax=Elysia crispata TaxID=231223 RepID=A0AAE1E3A1_9GAST|nr:hypothetical protein RRG08_065477 [Elysia crispata]